MSTEKSLVDSALRGWKSNVERVEKLFGDLSPGELEQEVAPGKNRLIYLWGHLAASSDRVLPLLGIGERLHPEFDAMFISNPDKSVPLTVSQQSLKAAWQEINQKLWEGFSKFSDSDWAQRHTAVSEQDFEREPHRSRFGVLLGRTAHLAYHLGQAALARPKAGYLIMNLTSNTILITGGGSGIGYELTKQLTALDKTILITGRDQSKIDRVKEGLPKVPT